MRRAAGALAAIALLLAAWSCGGEADTDRAPASGDTASAAGTAGGPPVDSAAATGTAGPGAPAVDSADERPLRSRRLLLVNPRAEGVVVRASAGLQAVVLDSLAARDSSEVNVESRAPRVGLQALVEGRQVGADSLDLILSEPARWAVPGGDSSPSPPADSTPG